MYKNDQPTKEQLLEEMKYLEDVPTKSNKAKEEKSPSSSSLKEPAKARRHDVKSVMLPRLLTIGCDSGKYLGYYNFEEVAIKLNQKESVEPFEYREFMSGNTKNTRCYYDAPRTEPSLRDEEHMTSFEEHCAGSVVLMTREFIGNMESNVRRLSGSRVYTKQDYAYFSDIAEELRQVRFVEKRKGIVEAHAKYLIERFSKLDYKQMVCRRNTISNFERKIMVNQGFSMNLAIGEELLRLRDCCKTKQELVKFMSSLKERELRDIKLAIKRNPSRMTPPVLQAKPVDVPTQKVNGFKLQGEKWVLIVP